MKNFWKLVIAVAVAEGAGTIGSFFTAPAIPTWYAGLARPEIAPPNWVFAPVWTTLFALMGIAAYLVWVRPGVSSRDRNKALALFAAQLALNVLWSAVFFGLESPGGALLEIIVLWWSILVTIIAFARISRPAAWLLAPYILWVTFAAHLNYTIWTLN